MRYNVNEQPILVGNLPYNQNVKIEILNLNTDELVELNDNVCYEYKNIKGIYLFDTNIIKEKFEGFTNLFYVMTDEIRNKTTGKFIYGGEDTKMLNDIYSSQLGSWKIENSTMIIYDKDDNIIAKFSLLDKYGNPSETQIYYRKRI